MKENINIAEILKDAPNTTKLYSPIYGKVRFDRLRTDNETIEVSVDNAYKHFDYYGRAIWHNSSDVMLTGEECLLFPSKDNRDWSTFRITKEHKCLNSNGFDYVDLGLPSGTKWATMNVGASKPSDYGLYFQWGDTIGYRAKQVGYNKLFNRHDYKWNPKGDVKTFKKYATEGAKLELMDDAAHINMGGSWHIPTPTQLQELIDNTISKWTKQGGVSGKLFISKKDSSKFIFIPAAGIAWDDSVVDNGYYAYIWSSMLDEIYIRQGQCLYLDSHDANLSDGERYSGRFVRGVIG